MRNKANLFSYFSILLVVLSVVLAPVFAVAKESDEVEVEIHKSGDNSEDSSGGEKKLIIEDLGLPGTTKYLASVLNDLYSGTLAKMSYNDAKFCDTMAEVILALPTESKSTLAWNQGSYSSSARLELKDDDSRKVSFQKIKQAYSDVNISVDNLSAKEGLDRGQVYVFNAQKAIVRSVLIDGITSHRNEDSASERVNKMSNLGYGAMLCLEKNVSESTRADLVKIKNVFANLNVGTVSDDSSKGESGKSEKNKNKIKHDDVDYSDDSNKATIVSTQVGSEDDLKSFSKGLMKDDKSIREVSFDDSSVSFVYAQKAKLLGFIPVWQKNKISSTNAGEVKIIKPWYAFLTREPVGVSESELLTKLDEKKLLMIDESGEVSSEVKASLEKKYDISAKILEVLSGVVKSKNTTVPVIEETVQAQPETI